MDQADADDQLSPAQKLIAIGAFTLAVLGSLAALVAVLLYSLIFVDFFTDGSRSFELSDLQSEGFWVFASLFVASALSLAMGIHNAVIAWRQQEFIESRWRRYIINSFVAGAPLMVSNLFRLFL